MYEFTIYTEMQEGIASFVSAYFQSFTLRKTKGYYKGGSEDSVEIVIVTEGEDVGRVFQLAKAIKTHYNQDSVLMTHKPIEARSI